MTTPVSKDPRTELAIELADDLRQVEQLIKERADSEIAERIGRIADHLLGSGGKRVRAMLALASARLLGHSGSHHVLLAAAVEFIHTATLLHDDVVDESRQRRGRPSANLLWDNKSSILVGDFFFARSFQLMVGTGSLEALTILSDASATISEAEVLQLVSGRDLQLDEADYYRIINGKTAALFAAAAKSAAVVAGADGSAAEALGRYGASLGTAYQIADDLLDYSGQRSSIGKDVGDDFRERKVTLPVIKAMAMAGEEERAFWRRVIADGDQREGDFDRAKELLRRSGALDQARSDAEGWSKAAREALDSLPPGRLTDLLGDLADFAVSRRN